MNKVILNHHLETAESMCLCCHQLDDGDKATAAAERHSKACLLLPNIWLSLVICHFYSTANEKLSEQIAPEIKTTPSGKK